MITIEEIKSRAPAALATKPAAHCSPRYTFIPTMAVVDALRKDGFVPVDAKQDARLPDRWGAHLHARHMVTMRMRGTETMDARRMMGGLVPELRWYNSSDAGSPAALELSVYRQVCSNGLCAWSVEGQTASIHKYTSVEEVIERARALSQSSKPLFDKIQRWTKIRLDPLAQARFATQALIARLGGSAERAKAYDPATMTAARREEDAEPTLWNLFNRAQENGMHGFVAKKEAAEQRGTLRPINAISAEREFNIAMWALAEKWAAYVK